MEQLFRYLESHKITSFLIREVSNPNHVGNVFVEPGEAVSFLSDGIIVLYNVYYKTGSRGRAIEVLKMRGANIVRKIVDMEIKGGKGLIVYPEKDLGVCHGRLKEELQGIIIKRLHTYIVDNIGEIDETLDLIVQGSEPDLWPLKNDIY